MYNERVITAPIITKIFKLPPNNENIGLILHNNIRIIMNPRMN